MAIHEARPRPIPWADRKRQTHPPWKYPFQAFDHLIEWLAHLMSRWVLIEVLEYLGKFSILIAAVFYFAESGDRMKQKHYQAWQVINTAQGKGGSGGRLEALHELHMDHVPLVGVDVSGAFLQGVHLRGANLTRSNFQASDVRDCDLQSANLYYANLKFANFRECTFSGANLEDADLHDADLQGAKLTQARLANADFGRADLRNTDLRGVHWERIAGVTLANIAGVRNAPAGFESWALSHGAVSLTSDRDWEARLDSEK